MPTHEKLTDMIITNILQHFTAQEIRAGSVYKMSLFSLGSDYSFIEMCQRFCDSISVANNL